MHIIFLCKISDRVLFGKGQLDNLKEFPTYIIRVLESDDEYFPYHRNTMPLGHVWNGPCQMTYSKNYIKEWRLTHSWIGQGPYFPKN